MEISKLLVIRRGVSLLIIAVFFCGICFGRPEGDLCKWMNGRKYYITEGEMGTISVGNVTSQMNGNETNHPRIPQRCSVELITCPSCHIIVTVLYLNIPTCGTDGACRCDYVWVKEPTVGKSGREFCGQKSNDSSLVYESKTKLLSIDFLYSDSYTDAFTLEFTAEKNVYYFKGQTDYYQGSSSGYIESPHFPTGYPADYSAEYVIQNTDSRGFVQLVFTDFQLSPWSSVEVLNSNGTTLDVYNGNTFRPPIHVSAGPNLTIRFKANDEYPNPGFRAKYTFVNYPEKYWFTKPDTDCGGIVEDLGGAITMMNMAAPGSTHTFDCIWLVRPRASYAAETHLSVRVAQFEEMGPKSILDIREGLTSMAYLLESLSGHQHHKAPQGQEYIIPASSGAYIRLQGTFNNKSRLAIVYSPFSYETTQCQNSGDFLCGNGRCLKTSLHCDGFNHCGDGSDEAACYANSGEGLTLKDSNWWRTLTPNYYFPKQDNSGTSGTNTLILITSLAGLGMFVLTTVMILVKLHKQRKLEVMSRESLRTISGEIDTDSSPSHGRQTISSEPPLYDPPPSYEDVIKFYMPPPPAYSTIVENQSRTAASRAQSARSRTSRDSYGIDNPAYTPEDQAANGNHQSLPSRVTNFLRVLTNSASDNHPIASLSGRAGLANTTSAVRGDNFRGDNFRGENQGVFTGQHRASPSKTSSLLRVILPPVHVFDRRNRQVHKALSATEVKASQNSHPHSSQSLSVLTLPASGVLQSAGLVHALLDRCVPQSSSRDCSQTQQSASIPSPRASSSTSQMPSRCQGTCTKTDSNVCECQGACSCPSALPVRVKRLLYSKYWHLHQVNGPKFESKSIQSPEKVASVPSKYQNSQLNMPVAVLQADTAATGLIWPSHNRVHSEITPMSQNQNSVRPNRSATELSLACVPPNIVEQSQVNVETQPLLRRTSSLPDVTIADGTDKETFINHRHCKSNTEDTPVNYPNSRGRANV